MTKSPQKIKFTLIEREERLEGSSARLRGAADRGRSVEPVALDRSHDFRLRYVSLETCSTCTQGCYFCPVGVAPRPTKLMPTELFETIVSQLAAHRDTIEGVGLSNYNEPTADRRFVEQSTEG